MSGIWVFVEQFQGEPASVSWEAIGLDAGITSKVTWPEVTSPPASTSQVEIIDGGSMTEKAEKLVDKLIADKVV